jgi:D-3-phosphoglycerate dehydrogenase
MAVARNVAEGCSSLKAGKWERSKFTGIELKGKTLAIVGAGKGRPMPKNKAFFTLILLQLV